MGRVLFFLLLGTFAISAHANKCKGLDKDTCLTTDGCKSTKNKCLIDKSTTGGCEGLKKNKCRKTDGCKYVKNSKTCVAEVLELKGEGEVCKPVQGDCAANLVCGHNADGSDGYECCGDYYKNSEDPFPTCFDGEFEIQDPDDQEVHEPSGFIPSAKPTDKPVKPDNRNPKALANKAKGKHKPKPISGPIVCQVDVLLGTGSLKSKLKGEADDTGDGQSEVGYRCTPAPITPGNSGNSNSNAGGQGRGQGGGPKTTPERWFSVSIPDEIVRAVGGPEFLRGT